MSTQLGKDPFPLLAGRMKGDQSQPWEVVGKYSHLTFPSFWMANFLATCLHNPDASWN